MISFNTPCLRWKFIAAEKLQNGWPGFIAPNVTRYLHKDVVVTTTPTFGYGTPSQSPSGVLTSSWDMDRLGNITQTGVVEADFPYGEPLPEDPVQLETWVVTDTHFHHHIQNPEFVIDTDVTLSNPYTVAELNADLDALIGAVDPASVPWGTIVFESAAETRFALADPNNLIPAQYNYARFLNAGSPKTAPFLAAAYSAFLPGLVAAIEWFPNSAVKVVGYIAMTGNYCLNTFTIDANQDVLDQTCQSGTGSCSASAIVVTPPPVSSDTNAYIILTPNCQCGE